MDKVRVAITCELRSKYCKYVDMSRDDFEKYDQLINSDMKNHEIDSKLSDIAAKYGFSCRDENWLDGDEPEEFEFELVID